MITEMCGLLLYLGKKKISYDLFKKSLELQNHRGPDSSQIYIRSNSKNTFSKNYNYGEFNFLIGHNRLSVVDLSEKSNQPIFDKNKKNFLLFNGEFYNFRDFSNNENKYSDTKTLFSGLELEGLKFFEKVNGPWATVYGNASNKIFLSRDLYGKKPLYYFKDSNRLIVSSEIKSIYKILMTKREVNIDNLVYFLGSNLSPYISSGSTFYKNIHSVKPGQILVFDISTFDIKHHSQINLNSLNFGTFNKNIIETISQFENEFKNSIDIRFAADAKVGVSLSGGVDSLLILSLLNKKQLNNTSFYTIFDDERDEDFKYLKKLKEEINFNHIRIPFNYSFHSFQKYLNILSEKMEIPVNYYATAIPTLIISEKMKKDKVKVCIDGIGGDEIMGGYPIYEKLSKANLREKKVLESIKNLIRYYNYFRPTLLQFLKTTMSILNYGLNKSKLSAEQKKNIGLLEITSNSLIKKRLIEFNENLVINKVLSLRDSQLYNIKSYIPYYTGISDSVNMTNSVESRSPFLDKRLFKYIFMNDNLKYNKGFNKYMLRKLLSLKLGNYYGLRRSKQGFTTFYSDKFTNEKKNLEIVLDNTFIRSIFSIKDKEKLNNFKPNTKRQLISLAYLDNNYNLKI